MNNKLDEHVLGFSSIGRLQKLAGIQSNIPFSAISEEAEKEEDCSKKGTKKKNSKEVNEGLEDDIPDEQLAMDLQSPDNPGADPVASKDDMDPMGDDGIPGEIGSDPIEEPMDTEIEPDMDSEVDLEPSMDSELELDDISSGPDDMVDMGALDSLGGDDITGGPVGFDAGGMDPMDATGEIESALSTISSRAPDIKISDYRNIVQQAEEVVAQLRSMGSQYLKENKRITVELGRKSFREVAKQKGGFQEKLLEAYSIQDSKKNTRKKTR